MTRREQARVSAGASLEEAARIAGVRPRYYRRMELHQHVPMPVNTMLRLGRAWKCDPMLFMDAKKKG